MFPTHFNRSHRCLGGATPFWFHLAVKHPLDKGKLKSMQESLNECSNKMLEPFWVIKFCVDLKAAFSNPFLRTKLGLFCSDFLYLLIYQIFTAVKAMKRC